MKLKDICLEKLYLGFLCFTYKHFLFDFDSVTFMDSAGIGLIIGRYKFTNMLGGKLEVANLTQSVKKIFEMSGILKLIPIAQLGTYEN